MAEVVHFQLLNIPRVFGGIKPAEGECVVDVGLFLPNVDAALFARHLEFPVDVAYSLCRMRLSPADGSGVFVMTNPTECAREIAEAWALQGRPFLDHVASIDFLVSEYDRTGFVPHSFPWHGEQSMLAIWTMRGGTDRARRRLSELIARDGLTDAWRITGENLGLLPKGGPGAASERRRHLRG